MMVFIHMMVGMLLTVLQTVPPPDARSEYCYPRA